MVKYSVIVPVYNVSNYIEKCLKSIFNQTFKNYELIIINDGSTDDSEKKIKRLIKNRKNVIYINQKNQGLSMARNNGVKKAKGEYLLFVDSDDYIEKNLLKKLSACNSDLIRFQIAEVNNEKIINFNEKEIFKTSGILAFNEIVKYHFIETAWAYCYKTEFYKKNKFQFQKGMYHEDFGLIPYIIFKAKTFESINYIGYYYIQRENSIMSSNDYKKEVKKAFDFLEQYIILKNKFLNYNYNDTKYFLSFIANCAILKIRKLKGKDYMKYKKTLEKEDAFDYILKDNFKRKVKFLIMKCNLKIYLNIFRG